MPKTLTLPHPSPKSLERRSSVDLKQYYSTATGNAKMPVAKWAPGESGFPTIKASYNFDQPSARKGKHAGK